MTAPDHIWLHKDEIRPELSLPPEKWVDPTHAVQYTRAPLAEALAVPEVAALVTAVDSAFANVDAQIDDAGEFTSASWLALRHAVAGLWTLHPSPAALRAIGERAE